MFARLTPIVKNLLIVNVVIYVLLSVLGGAAMRTGDSTTQEVVIKIYEQFQLYKSDLIFERPPRWEGKFRPAQIVTHFFNHGGILHIFFNMFVLALIGPGVEMVLGSRRFLKFYLFCGVLGGILIALLDPSPIPVVGASGAIFGVVVAFALFFPREKFYLYFLFPVEARWFAIGIGVFSAFMVMREYISGPSGDQISHFGHLAGMISAITYFYLRRWVPFLE